MLACGGHRRLRVESLVERAERGIVPPGLVREPRPADQHAEEGVFDPERLAPPKLDNTSKPAKRSEEAIVVEAMLRSLDPSAARQFETLPPAPQESFRKSFAEFLSTYPTAPDSRRLAFVRQALDEAVESLPETDTPQPTQPSQPSQSAPATPTPPDR